MQGILVLDLVVKKEMKSGQSVNLQDSTQIVHNQLSLSFLLSFFTPVTRTGFCQEMSFRFFMVDTVVQPKIEIEIELQVYIFIVIACDAKVCQEPAPDVPVLPTYAPYA